MAAEDAVRGRTAEAPTRRLVVTEYLSLDGVMEDPGGAEQFEHGGWTALYWGDDIGQFQLEGLRASDALLLGRVTYQGFAAAWPSMTHEAGEYADRMNGYPKHVASTSLHQVEWNNSRLIEGNVAEAVSALKRQPGRDILVYGSGELVRTLMRHGLVDEYRLLVYPVVLGSGKRLFQDASRVALKPVGTKTFSSGVVALFYQPAE